MNAGVVPRYDLPNAAPEPLRLVQRFVNTVDEEHGREWWPTPEALTGWFREHGIAADALDEDDLRQAYELRAALQALLRGNNGGDAGSEARNVVNEAARTLRLRLDGSLRIVAADAFGHVLAVAFEAMLDGGWSRLKACRQCGWAFYDYSRNRSGSWCSMQICGNRLKTRSYRRRKRGAR
jgi:predicted RNA-binding Zn ribbon-like protein